VNLAPAGGSFACPRCRRDHANVARELDLGDFLVCPTCYGVAEVEHRAGVKTLGGRQMGDVPVELRAAIVAEKRGIERRRGGS
jgi:hypothetical protein